MEIQSERKVEGPCSFPCSLSSLLTLNCRARAEGLARRLQTHAVQNDPSSGVEGTLLVESDDKVGLTTSEGRVYSLDDHNIDTFKTAEEKKKHRPIHVVTSEPTLHLSLDPQPPEVDDIGAGSPTEEEQEQDSDVYYDFDLVTPPEDYACTSESRMATREMISEESERPEKPESGCVTSVTSPIMFAGGNYSLPPSNPPSPHEDCPPELLGSRASEIDLNAIRRLLVSSKLRSLCTMSDSERPFAVTDSMRPDFVGVVRAGSENLSATPSDKSSSFDRSSSDEGELIVPIHEEEKTLVLSEEDVTCNSSFYLPPPSSYQIFSNRESCFDSIEMPSASARKQTKTSKRRVRKKKPCAHNSKVSESSDSRESETHDREFPLTRVGEEILTLESLSQRHKCSYKQDFHRSHSEEWEQEAKMPKISQSSKSVEEYTDEVLSDSTPNDPIPFPSDTGNDSLREKAPLIKSKTGGKMFYMLYNSSNESISSPEDKSITPSTCINEMEAFESISPNAGHKEEASKMSSRTEHHVTEQQQQQLPSTFLNEDLVLREIDDAISLLKKETEDIAGKDSAIPEEQESERLALGSIAGELCPCPEQVVGSHFGSAFDAQNECQQFVPGSQRCELCEEAVPFLSFKNEFGEGIGDLITGDSTCLSFSNIENTQSELSKRSEREMHKSKGRVKVKGGNAETDTFLGGAELPEETASNFDLKLPQQDLNNFKSSKNCDRETYAPDKEPQRVFTRDGARLSAGAKENCVCSNEDKNSDKSLVPNSRKFVEHNSEDINMHKSKSKVDKNSTENYRDTSLKTSDSAKQFVSKDEQPLKESDGQLPSETVAGHESKSDENYEVSTQDVSAKLSKREPSLDETSHMPQRNPDWPWSRRRRFKNIGFSHSNHDEGKTLSPQSDSTSLLNDHQSSDNSCQNEPLYNISASPKLCRDKENVQSPVSKEVDSLNNQAENNNAMLLAKESVCSNKPKLFFDDSSPLQHDETNQAVGIPLCNDLKGQNNETKSVFVKKSEFNRDLSLNAETRSIENETHETSTRGEIDKVPESTSNKFDLDKVSDDDELIETLPEKSIEDDERKTEDELKEKEDNSDEEEIITGRFKNLTNYTEKIKPSFDDGLPPPPMEVILVDYNESLEVNPEEDAPVTEDIREDLASELNRLQMDEPTIHLQSDESERSSQERETDIDRQQRIKRSSSLRCGKTPPGTPGRKKIVRFADCLGLDLADIRTFLDGVPNVPPSAFCDLEVEEDNTTDGSGHSSLPSYSSYSAAASAAAAILENQARRIITPMFQQPGALPDFYDRLREQKVVLENVSVGVDLSVKGVVRVINEAYHKKVFIRYTFDHWKNFHEATATYMDGSCDGISDRFSFLLWGSFLQSNGSLIFCVKFCVNDKQYWDNNRGANYYLHCYSTQPQNLPLSTSKIPPLDGRPQNHCNIHQHHHPQEQPALFSLHHGGSSFLDTPTTPSDPWISRFF